MNCHSIKLVFLGAVLCASAASADPYYLSNVPAYDWYHGCGPTAAASIIGYYDVHGCDNLFDASGWDNVKLTSNVQDQISSPEHNAAYDLSPDPGYVDPDDYNCIADWFRTSVDPLGYGGSYQYRADDALEEYAQYRGYSTANSWYERTSTGAFTWDDLVGEIDAGRPMMFLVDSSGDGGTDHFVPVFGYDDRGDDGKFYGCYTTWTENETIVWKQFRSMSSSYTWGVGYGTYFTIPFNNSPVAVNDAYSLNEDNTLTISDTAGVLANDTDPDGDSLTAIEVTSTAHGTLTLYSNGSLNYTPEANYNGVDTFTYKANDGTIDSDNVATVTLNIAAINDAPVATNDVYDLNEDTRITCYSYENGLLLNDTDVEGDSLTAIKVTDTEHGTLTFYSSGGLVYTPNANYNGTDTFTYKVNDGADDSNVATVTLNIAAVNDAPIAEDDSFNLDEDGHLSLYGSEGILLNDDDVDEGDTIEAVLVSDVSHGSLTLYANGGLYYMPQAGFSGIDSFTYQAFDGELYSELTTVMLEVLAAPVLVPGDTNGDEIVNETDSDVMSDNWGEAVSGGASMGDFNDDGYVDAIDASILAANWGDHTGESAVVPEPSMLCLLLTLVLGGLGIRRR